MVNETTENTESADTTDTEKNENVESLKDAQENKAAAEQEDFKQKFYYLAAEFENARKRFEREKDSLAKYGNEKVMSSLLEVVDNFERTAGALDLDQDPKTKNIAIGINMVKKQFLDVLASFGLTQVESLGKTFDPNFHEAMAQQPVEGKPDQEIIQVYAQGYVLNGRLIRAAKVVIVKN
jgi:molecular chaperone GrpE